MRRTAAFLKRNALEMTRDPVTYVFCLGFPVIMIILFQVINACTHGTTPVFEAPSLIPGIVMFSFTFVMLSVSLLVSKDRRSAFLVRLYASPMRTVEFLAGYALPFVAVGVLQEVVCILFGYIISLIVGGAFFTFGQAMLLMLEMLPMLFICIALGILLGSVFNDKSAPAITSALITAAGVLGGAWMPLDAMGGFETFCRCLPFYPAVYIGRIITGAAHTPVGTAPPEVYSFDNIAALGIIPVAVWFIAAVILAIVAFKRNMTSDKK